MTVKLTYDPTNRNNWGVALWIQKESRWVEQARFLFSTDALAVRKHYVLGYIAAPHRNRILDGQR